MLIVSMFFLSPIVVPPMAVCWGRRQMKDADRAYRSNHAFDIVIMVARERGYKW